jgi:hypothetical protein
MTGCRQREAGSACLTIDHVREDAHILYGFFGGGAADVRDADGGFRDWAEVGLERFEWHDGAGVEGGGCGGQCEAHQSVPGIGSKTAERIVVELRHKLSAGEAWRRWRARMMRMTR